MPNVSLSTVLDRSIEKHIDSVRAAVHSHLAIEVGFEPAADGRRYAHHAVKPIEREGCRVPFSEAAEGCNGSYLRAPVSLADGSLYGTFYCFSQAPQKPRDLQVLRMCADIVGDLVREQLSLETARVRRGACIERIIRKQEFSVVYQPIYRLSDGGLASFEALTRFAEQPVRPPNQWLAEAAQIGLGTELEFSIVRQACTGFTSIPADVALAVNLSPSAILSPDFKSLFQGFPVHRIIVEVTEHEAIDNYCDVERALAPLRQCGLRLAVDDAGAGYSSFKHVLDLKPDLIKLDMSLTRAINHDAGRRALAAALTQFGKVIGSLIVAEGVETVAELEALRTLGVNQIQGYLVGYPGSLEEATRVPRSCGFATGSATHGRLAAIGRKQGRRPSAPPESRSAI
jgi:EAL domain-containing protein (putative c-di-GMP-specific phosphodiesterase class I)